MVWLQKKFLGFEGWKKGLGLKKSR